MVSNYENATKILLGICIGATLFWGIFQLWPAIIIFFAIILFSKFFTPEIDEEQKKE